MGSEMCIRDSLSTLRYYQIIQGGSDPSLSAMPQLHYVLRDVARRQPRCNRPLCLPITIKILQRLFQVWFVALDHYEAVMLWAACTLGFLHSCARASSRVCLVETKHCCHLRMSRWIVTRAPRMWPSLFVVARRIISVRAVHSILGVPTQGSAR